MSRNLFLGSILCLALVGESHAWIFGGGSKPPPEVIKHLNNITTLNEAVDVAMREVRLIIKSFDMDPFSTPNISNSFGFGDLSLSNMRVFNLSTINRTDDVGVYDNEPGKSVSISVSLGFEELQLFADYNAGSGWIRSAGKVRGKLPGVKIDFSVILDFATLKLTLNEFHLTKNDKNMELEFYDTLEAFLMNMFIGVAVGIFGNVILSVVEGPIKTQIVSMIDNLNVVLEQTLDSMAST